RVWPTLKGLYHRRCHRDTTLSGLADGGDVARSPGGAALTLGCAIQPLRGRRQRRRGASTAEAADLNPPGRRPTAARPAPLYHWRRENGLTESECPSEC